MIRSTLLRSRPYIGSPFEPKESGPASAGPLTNTSVRPIRTTYSLGLANESGAKTGLMVNVVYVMVAIRLPLALLTEFMGH
jgi:hypothetical protein